MVRKVQKKAVKPSTAVIKPVSKTKKEEELSNGYADNESEDAPRIEKETQENVDSGIIEQEGGEAISSENPKTLPKSRKRKSPVPSQEENVDTGITEQEEAISSENPKSVPKSRKRKSPVPSKEVKEKKKLVAKTKAKRQKGYGDSESENTENDTEVETTGFTVTKSGEGVDRISVILENVDDGTTKQTNFTEEFKTSSKNSKCPPKTQKKKIASIEVKDDRSVTKRFKKRKVLLEISKIKSVPAKVFVIGENDVGQLGLGEDITEKRRPALLELPHSIVDIAAGGMHSVCLTESGEVITFGCNDEGALGRITSEEGSEHIPRRVDIAERIVQVSAGDSHTAALSDSGQVYIWGNFRNGNGPMGLVRDGQKECLPVKILNDVTIVKIASGTEHLVCLSQEGAVYTCGCGEAGQLGRVSGNASVDGGRKGKIYLLTPDKVPVSRLSDIVNNIWTGSYSTFVHVRNQDSGSIYAFGLNNYNQLGFRNAGEETMSLKPKKINSFNNKTWQQIIGGQHHTMALDNNGLVHSLGRADYGRLGLGENSDVTSEPTEIPTLHDKNCIDISCGNCVSFAVADNGSAYSWGMGTSNQLGHGNDNDQDTPLQIEGNFVSSWKALKTSGGGQHTLILATPRESSKESK